MASACVNNIGMSQAAKTYPSYAAWLSPRISFSLEEGHPQSKAPTPPSFVPAPPDPPELPDPVDFEFRLENPVAMLPADELFSDGKLMPLKLPHNITGASKVSNASDVNSLTGPVSGSVDQSASSRRMQLEDCGTDPYLLSPKAPRCSSRWKELLGFRKLCQNPNNGQKPDKTAPCASSSPSSTSTSHKSLKHFLHKSSKPCGCIASLDHSLNFPLLKDCDYLDPVSVPSSRLSLSSSPSQEHEDLPSLSTNAEKPSAATTATAYHPSPNPFVLNRAHNIAVSRPRMLKARPSSSSASSGWENIGWGSLGRNSMRREVGESGGVGSRGVSVDSPRMNPSGKVVFHGLERSSSSPSSLNGRPRFKHRGMERSYSANVRVTPVLNVPVCSLRGSSKSFGFAQLFSSPPQKKEGINKGQYDHHHHQQPLQSSSRNRTDRT